MVEVEVTFDYEAEQDDELTIKVGNIIKNVKMVEGGWWEGDLNGKSGMFPDNFVKVIEKPKEEPPPKMKTAQRSSVKELANKLKEVPMGTSGPKKKDTKKKKATVVYEYEPENSDELKLEVGDIVEILKQEEEGWWEGINNGKKGMFPSNFVEEIEEKDSDKLEQVPEEKPKETHDVKKKVMGVGLGNIFAGGPINLRSTTGSKKEKDVEIKPVVEDPPVVKREKPAAVERAVVRYSYTASNEDELTLKEDELVVILDKKLEDPGWWKGEVNGKVGLFPDNFVEIISPEESGTSVNPSPVTHNKSPPQPKPKKPPPPSNVKQPPKLPDKAPVSDSAKLPEPLLPEKTKKKEPEHTEKHPQLPEKNAPPTITSKKPSIPPPVGRKPKPVTSAEQKIMPPVVKEESKPTVSHSSKDGEEQFDALEPTSDKLTHLTASRAKGPSKRPPSQQQSTRRPWKEDEKMNGDVIKEPAHRRPPPPSMKEEKEEQPPPKPSHGAPARPPDPHLGSVNVLSAIEELKREIRDLKANTVSKKAFDELKAENEKLKQDLENFKLKQTRKFKDLFNEVDEEKKIRLSTQVEMERIKKLVSESHV